MIRPWHKKEITLFGLNTLNVSMNVEKNNNFDSDFMLGARLPFTKLARKTISIEACFVVGKVELEQLMRMYGNRLSFDVSCLGDSKMCAHCRYPVIPGCLACPKCGSVMKRTVNASKYNKVATGMRMEYIDYTESASVWEHLHHVDTVFYVDELYASDNPFSGWQTTHLPGGWICDYCHTIHGDEYNECPNCSAGRLPYSDLGSIPSNCLYCGRRLGGATICSACTSAKNGYSAWLPRADYTI